jgi:nicotinate dehydrogenase subunit B
MEAIAISSRRGFLKSGGALVVSFGIKSLTPRKLLAQDIAAEDAHPASEVDSFLAIHQDGSATIFTSHVDIGTGIATVFRQVAAEELGIPVERFTVVEGDTALTPNHGGTGGSSGVPRGAADIRRAAATARQALLDLGATRLNLPASELTIEAGEVRRANGGGAGIAVATLIGGRRFALRVDPKAPLKDPMTYSTVGKPILRADVPSKCAGRHVYLQDWSVPGMLHGRVVRPPSFGARLVSVDESSLRGIPDVRVVRIESFLGVVAKDEWAAIRGARELEATWSDWQGLPENDDLEHYLRESPAVEQVVVNRGDAATALAGAGKPYSATYYWPFQSHASMGPSCAVAEFKESGTTVWSATQNPFGLRTNLARVFGIAAEKLRVIYLDASGSYGTNGAEDAAADALLLSRAVGQPVRVQWMRPDEHGWDPKGPVQLLDVRAALEPDGRIAAWETQMWLPGGPVGERALVGPEFAAMKQGHGEGAGLMTMNADPPYGVPHVRVVAHNLRDTPLRLSNLRAPGKIANVFAVEGLTDELAAACGMDAVAYRRRGLTDPRALAVLDRAAAVIGWQPRPSPNPRPMEGNFRVGRGIAYMRYKQAENYVALAVDVAVERATGKIFVRRITCAHDCGLIVNPDGLRNQVEGNIMHTLSRTLHEEVRFDRSRVTSVDWNSYPVLRFPEAPSIEVALIDHPDQPPYGAGEAASAPVAAAVANAVFDATGIRLRRVPFAADRMKTLLALA